LENSTNQITFALGGAGNSLSEFTFCFFCLLDDIMEQYNKHRVFCQGNYIDWRDTARQSEH
jgi:hypothetical protein